jgi:hypothetical protein
MNPRPSTCGMLNEKVLRPGVLNGNLGPSGPIRNAHTGPANVSPISLEKHLEIEPGTHLVRMSLKPAFTPIVGIIIPLLYMPLRKGTSPFFRICSLLLAS